jgi:hypothetical protein
MGCGSTRRRCCFCAVARRGATDPSGARRLAAPQPPPLRLRHLRPALIASRARARSIPTREGRHGFSRPAAGVPRRPPAHRSATRPRTGGRHRRRGHRQDPGPGRARGLAHRRRPRPTGRNLRADLHERLRARDRRAARARAGRGGRGPDHRRDEPPPSQQPAARLRRTLRPSRALLDLGQRPGPTGADPRPRRQRGRDGASVHCQQAGHPRCAAPALTMAGRRQGAR